MSRLFTMAIKEKENPPACTTCKHYFNTFWHAFNGRAPRCMKDAAKHDEYDPVSGKIVKAKPEDLERCRDERRDPGSRCCGPEGKFWEAKSTKSVFIAIKHQSKNLS